MDYVDRNIPGNNIPQIRVPVGDERRLEAGLGLGVVAECGGGHLLRVFRRRIS